MERSLCAHVNPYAPHTHTHNILYFVELKLRNLVVVRSHSGRRWCERVRYDPRRQGFVLVGYALVTSNSDDFMISIEFNLNFLFRKRKMRTKKQLTAKQWNGNITLAVVDVSQSNGAFRGKRECIQLIVVVGSSLVCVCVWAWMDRSRFNYTLSPVSRNKSHAFELYVGTQ